MKKLLLLFIPLVFFFSCENEEEESADCSCGEVIDIDVTQAFGGDLVPVIDPNTGLQEVDPISGDPIFELNGAHEGYSMTRVQMNCSQDIITLCDILEIGDSFCFDYVGDCYFAECRWVEDVPVSSITGGVGAIEFHDMLLQSITIDGGYIIQENGGANMLEVDTTAFDCN